MLKIAEDIPITLNRELDTFERLIEQDQEPLTPQEFTLTKTFTDLIEERLQETPDRRAEGRYGPSHDVCPANCCLPGTGRPSPWAEQPGT